MPNTDALRDLQTRLSSRLQDARDQPRESGWLAVICAEARLLLPLAEAGEIVTARELIPLPHTKPWVAGVANLRAHVHVVIDLAGFLRLRNASPGDAGHGVDGSWRRGEHLVLLNPALNLAAALAVDRLAGLREASELERVPADGRARPAFAGELWRDRQDTLWQALELTALARDPSFLDIAA